MSRQYITDFTERAQSAYDRLPKTMQSRVDQTLLQIEQIGPRRPYAAKLAGPEKLYVARVASDLRIVLQIEDDLMTILDIVTHAQLQRLSRFWL